MGNVGVAEIAQPISLMIYLGREPNYTSQMEPCNQPFTVAAKIYGVIGTTLEATLTEDGFGTIPERNGGITTL